MPLNFIQRISIQVNDLGIDIQSSAVHVLIYPGSGLDELIRDSHTVPYLLISALSLSPYQYYRVPHSIAANFIAIYNRKFCKTQKIKMLGRDKICGEKNIIDRH